MSTVDVVEQELQSDLDAFDKEASALVDRKATLLEEVEKIDQTIESIQPKREYVNELLARIRTRVSSEARKASQAKATAAATAARQAKKEAQAKAAESPNG